MAARKGVSLPAFLNVFVIAAQCGQFTSTNAIISVLARVCIGVGGHFHLGAELDSHGPESGGLIAPQGAIRCAKQKEMTSKVTPLAAFRVSAGADRTAPLRSLCG